MRSTSDRKVNMDIFNKDHAKRARFVSMLKYFLVMSSVNQFESNKISWFYDKTFIVLVFPMSYQEKNAHFQTQFRRA